MAVGRRYPTILTKITGTCCLLLVGQDEQAMCVCEWRVVCGGVSGGVCVCVFWFFLCVSVRVFLGVFVFV